MSEIIIGSLIAIGTIFSLAATIGIIRLPDLYTRTHAASKGATLGVLATLFGVFLFFWIEQGHMNGRLLLGIVFIFITTPVAGHLICRAAYNTNVPLWEKHGYDELKKSKKMRNN